MVPPTVRLIALGLFIFNVKLVYYAAELKPYASDILFSLIIYQLFDYINHHDFKMRRVLLFGVACGIILFASAPSMFIAGAIFLTMLVQSNQKKDRRFFIAWARSCAIYCVSFIAFFAANVKMVTNKYLLSTWDGSFLPVQDGLWASVHWLFTSCINMFAAPVTLEWPLFGFWIFLYGLMKFLSKKVDWGVIFALPILLCLAAACLGKYPFYDRMLLFLLPALCLFCAVGIYEAAARFKFTRNIVLFMLLLAVFVKPIEQTVDLLVYKYVKEDNRSLMKYFDRHYISGDTIVYNNSGQYAFLYYINFYRTYERIPKVESWRPKFKGKRKKIITYKTADLPGFFQGKEYVLNRQEGHILNENGFEGRVEVSEEPLPFRYIEQGWQPEIVRNKRVWLIFSRFEPKTKDFIVARFSEIGQAIDARKWNGTEIYLYQMR